MDFTITFKLPAKEFYTTGHVSSQDVANLPADRRDCQICMTQFKKITTNDLEKDPLLAEETVATCGPVGSGCRRYHMFHSKCIGTWLEMNNTCPACRMVVYSKEQQDEDVPLFDEEDSDDEAVAQPDDYADYLTRIANVAPTFSPTEQQHEQPQEPWYEVHAQYLENMVKGRIEAWRAAGDIGFDEELYSASAAMPTRPALSGYQGKGTLHATKLVDHLRRFFWHTFTANLPKYMATGKFGAVCHPAAMLVWEKLDRAIRRGEGRPITVTQLQQALDQVLEEEDKDVPVAVRPFVDAMIEEVLMAFEVSAMTDAEEKEERRRTRMMRTLMGSKMRILPTWLAHQEHMKMLPRRR
ncbi:hypothetical protein EJ03DRAFT_335726 [Teratosphaeria nubilosa]|uniref:RING-type domain-containing protein n=1 Tax=Teratosphaeria nubilosa TaxID=161662 RepID=A0A6G1LAV2_9PEZI|nr:hypothetical protein EJ03DRAFT_335726 [Teratosphaeria nubilosa]